MKTGAAIAVVVAALALLACGGDESKDATVTPTTGAQTSVTATTPAGATTSPTPSAARCPVEQRICDFALTLLPVLQRGDIDALVAMAEPVPAKCPSAGFGGPSIALCAGAAAGETRRGFWDVQAGEGLIVTETEWRRTLDRFKAAVLAATGSDGYGPGPLRIASVACFREASQLSGTCGTDWIAVHFTYINPPNLQPSSGVGLPGQRMTFYVRAHVSGPSVKVDGVGFSVPPNAALEPLRLDATDSSGRRGVWENYVWRP